MKRILIVLMSMVFLTATVLFAAEEEEDVGWRCGNLFIHEGIQSFEVLQSCGEPNSKEVVGYAEHGGDDEGDAGLVIEKWLYGPDAGYYHVLYFKAGVLEKVEAVKDMN